MSRPQVIGLTGGLASGKSTVAALLREHGFAVLDADVLARELSQPDGAAHDAIVARFGTAERARLREIVFDDPSARRDLEAILHPRIAAESVARVQRLAASAPGRPVIYEAALLVETGRFKDFDGLIAVTAPSAARRERAMARDGLSAEEADAVMAAQCTDLERERAATWVVDNSGSIEALREAVARLARELVPGTEN